MRHEEQVALAERALRLIEANASERGEPATSPVERYLDPVRAEREEALVFRRYPLALCASADLAAPGDAFAIDVAGVPLLLVRGADGAVHGHVNACRHRGARLAAPGLSHQRAFVCPYHSWTYGLDGGLRGRPHDADFPHASAADCALVRVPAAEALGFVWAIAKPLGAGAPAGLDLDGWLGRFGADLRSWGYDRWVPFHRRAFDNAANWKLPFEGNLETYHFQYAHRDSIAGMFHDNLLIADHDRQHHRLFLPKRSIAELRGEPSDQWNVTRHANVLYCFFPSTLVLHEGDHANAFTVLPDGVARSRVLGTTLIPAAPASEKARVHWQRNVDSFWGALDEDFALGASSQSTLGCGAQQRLVFGRNEWCAEKFHRDVEAAIA